MCLQFAVGVMVVGGGAMAVALDICLHAAAGSVARTVSAWMAEGWRRMGVRVGVDVARRTMGAVYVRHWGRRQGVRGHCEGNRVDSAGRETGRWAEMGGGSGGPVMPPQVIEQRRQTPFGGA